MDTNKYTGLVIYTDGGNYKSNPGPIGSGIHCYLFNEKKLDGKYPIKDTMTSTHGYCDEKEVEKIEFPTMEKEEDFIQAVLDKEKKYPVNPIWFRDYAIGHHGISTNNVAEMRGMQFALELILKERPTAAVIFSDSEYVIKGLEIYLDKWIKGNWISSTGKPVSNKEEWLIIKGLRDRLKEENIPYRVCWLNGHADYKGNKKSTSSYANVHADEMASLGATIANNLNMFPDAKGNYTRQYTIEDIKSEKNPETIHPFLINKRLYSPYGGRTDKSRFYLGNPGYQIDDIYIGKIIPDTQVGIVSIPGGNEVIECIEDIQKKWLEQHYGHRNVLFALALDHISNKQTYQEIVKYKEHGISRPKGIPNLETVSGVPLTTVFDPPFLFANNIDRIIELENVLHSISAKSKLVSVEDITDQLYKTDEAEVLESEFLTVGEKVTYGKGLKKEMGTTFKSLEVNHSFGGDGVYDKVMKKIILITGIELPRRNQLKAIESMCPVVKLVSWHYTGAVYKFAVLILLHQKSTDGKLISSGYGIWHGSHSSQVLLLDKRD